MADYSIYTESNTIDIGQNAVENEGCVWNDKDSVITGADIANSIGSVSYTHLTLPTKRIV